MSRVCELVDVECVSDSVYEGLNVAWLPWADLARDEASGVFAGGCGLAGDDGAWTAGDYVSD